MQGKHVIITGGTSGIGQAAAEVLAGMGARIVLIARNRERAEATLGRLRTIAPEANHTAYFADLSLVHETRRVAEEIAGNESRIDVLMNNAGAIFGRREETEEGLERTFATNHVSYFVLTQGLLPRLAASTPARIINTSSRSPSAERSSTSPICSRSAAIVPSRLTGVPSCAISYLLGNWPASCPAAVSPQIACIPDSCGPGLRTTVRAGFRACSAWPRRLRFRFKKVRRLWSILLPRRTPPMFPGRISTSPAPSNHLWKLRTIWPRPGSGARRLV